MKEASARVTIPEQASARGHVMHEGEAIGARVVKCVFTPGLVAVGGEVGEAAGTDVCVVELLLVLLLLLLRGNRRGFVLFFVVGGAGAFGFSSLLVVVIDSTAQKGGEELSHLGLFVLDNKEGE